MSTGGQAAGGILGAIGGFLLAGPGGGYQGAMYGAQIGMMVGGYLDPVKTTVNGPRLSDLTVQTSTYGAVIPRIYGTVPIVGNVFWLEGNKLKEITKKKKSGGKGGPQTTTKTFSYYATFAVGLVNCMDGNPIAGARRVWIGSKLIYDARSSDLETIIASNNASSLFSLYLGTSTQTPDDRIQADMGIGSAPAYRGLAYLVLKDYPLADHGNSLLGAQVKVEVVAQAPSVTPFTLLRTITTPYTSPVTNSSFAPKPLYLTLEQVRVYVGNWDSNYPASSTFSVFDSRLDNFAFVRNLTVPGTSVPINGTSDNQDRYMYSRSQYFPTASGTQVNETTGYFYEQGDVLLWVSTNDVRLRYKMGPEVVLSVASKLRVGCTDGTSVFIQDIDGITKYDLAFNVLGYFAVSTPGITGSHWRSVFGDGRVWTLGPQGGPAYQVQSVSTNLSGLQYHGYLPYVFDYPTGVLNNAEIHIESGLLIRAWANVVAQTMSVDYFQINKQTFGTGVPLSSIVSAECLRSNVLSAGDIDVSALTQTVRGYKISSVSTLRSAIEPLQGVWPFDAIQHGYNINFVPRGGASVITVPASDLDARGAVDSPGISITNSREMDSQLPRRVSVKYLDLDREYDTGEQYDERLNTDAVNVLSLDLAIVMTADEAARVAQQLLYLYWMERYDLNFSLPPTYNQIEAGDVITVNATEASYTLRLPSVTYNADGRLECKAKYSRAAVYSPTAIGSVGQSAGQTLSLPGATETVLLDIPLLDDTLNIPGFPVAMAGYLSAWPGGQLVVSPDAGQTWDDVQGFSPPGSVIGTASNAIGAGRTELMDKASVLAISLMNGTLSSVTESALFAGSNWFAYGAHGRWEIIAAQTCALQGANNYLLSNLMRGLQGTEWACSQHVAGDKIIELESSSLAFITSNTNSIGLAKTYRGVTLGQTIDSASDLPFTYAGVNLECLAPVYINGDRIVASNDWTISWIRRTRRGGAWRDYVDASLGESSESYEVEIYAGASYTTVKRTIAVSSPSATYTSALQTTDFGASAEILYIKVYQISATVGRGYAAQAKLVRTGYYWDNTVALLHFDGTPGSSTVVDEKGHSFTTNGVLTKTGAVFGQTALGLNGSTQYLAFPAHADFAAISDFTLEWRFTGNPVTGCLLSTTGFGGMNWYSGTFAFPGASVATSASQETGTHEVSINRLGNVVTLHFDGIKKYTLNVTPGPLSLSSMAFGYYIPNGNAYIAGQFDEIRLTKVCRYTEDYTPKTSPFGQD